MSNILIYEQERRGVGKKIYEGVKHEKKQTFHKDAVENS